MTRRQFVVRTAKAGFSIATAAAVSYLTLDKKGPASYGESDNLVTIPDFSVLFRPSQTISIVKGPDRTTNLNKAIELLGGIDRFVKKGETVLIKPNAAFASPPLLGATTNPDLIAATIKLCYRAGAKKVLITDNPINDPASCFALSGIGKAADQAGAKIILPQKNFFKRTTLKNGKLIKNFPILYTPLEKIDKLIGIAPVKDHHRAGASMSIKNFYGLLGEGRNIFHQDINTIIAELAMMVKPTLVILDGTEVMITNGPTGGSISDLKKTNTLIAGCDMVAADSYASRLLDLTAKDLPYLKKAQQAGAGTTDYQSLKPLYADLIG